MDRMVIMKKNEVTRFVTYHKRSNINRDLLNSAYGRGVGGSGATLYVIRVGPASPDYFIYSMSYGQLDNPETCDRISPCQKRNLSGKNG